MLGSEGEPERQEIEEKDSVLEPKEPESDPLLGSEGEPERIVDENEDFTN